MAEKKATAKAVKPLAELRALDGEALVKKVMELRAELVARSRDHAAGELPNPRAISKLRKQIAQALTVLEEQAEAKATAEEKK